MIDAVVFDLDGTLFNLPPDCMPDGVFCKTSFRSNQHLAEPILPMINLIGMYARCKHRYEIIILTARPDLMRQDTESHLSAYGIEYSKLIMRDGDTPCDVAQYKVDHLKALTLSGLNIQMVFDDKQEIVDAANAAGYYAVKVP